MTDGEMLEYMGTDAKKWAEKFDEIQREKPDINLDPGVMISWFANAIEAGFDAGRKSTEQERTPRNVFEQREAVSFDRPFGDVPDWRSEEEVIEDTTDWSKQFDRLHKDRDGLPRL